MGINKEPFERIISLLDRKRILKKVLNEKSQIICRCHGGNLIPFVPFRLTQDGHLEGKLGGKSLSHAKQKTVILFFYCDNDRFFIHTKLSRQGELWRAPVSIEFFKLNRRQSFRTGVPNNTQLAFHVTAANGQRCNVMARVIEFSAGGARIRWFGNPSIDEGSSLKGKIIWLRDKEMPVQALVRHKLADGQFGIEFSSLDSVQVNRLKLMSIELQQFVNYLKS